MLIIKVNEISFLLKHKMIQGNLKWKQPKDHVKALKTYWEKKINQNNDFNKWGYRKQIRGLWITAVFALTDVSCEFWWESVYVRTIMYPYTGSPSKLLSLSTACSMSSLLIENPSLQWPGNISAFQFWFITWSSYYYYITLLLNVCCSSKQIMGKCKINETFASDKRK